MQVVISLKQNFTISFANPSIWTVSILVAMKSAGQTIFTCGEYRPVLNPELRKCASATTVHIETRPRKKRHYHIPFSAETKLFATLTSPRSHGRDDSRPGCSVCLGIWCCRVRCYQKRIRFTAKIGNHSVDLPKSFIRETSDKFSVCELVLLNFKINATGYR